MAREDEDCGVLSASEIQPGHNKRKLVACSNFDEHLQRSSTADVPSPPLFVPGSSSGPGTPRSLSQPTALPKALELPEGPTPAASPPHADPSGPYSHFASQIYVSVAGIWG